MKRLSDQTIGELPGSVKRPTYERGQLKTGIVHLGIGAFHRAHMAAYTDAVLASGDAQWGICGASLRNPATRDALEPQDGLYTLAIRDGAGEQMHVIGSVARLVVAPDDPQILLDRMSDADCHIVSLTVTEKGYCHLPATGELDEAHPDIVHDRQFPEAPRSAIGFIAQALMRRRQMGVPPFTVLSCDNLPANGQTARRVVIRFAELLDPEFGAFVKEHVAFPSTMVDRIVPATTDADREAVSAALGLTDAWPIMTEPFTQWIVEEHFPNGRPGWEHAGAVFVADVTPYELMKLRLLNGSHSTLAYLGNLAGYETVAEAMAAPGMAELLDRLMREASETLPPLEGIDLDDYRAALIARFRNPALKHRTAQIAMDGSQKLPQRLLGTIRDRLAKGQDIASFALGVAAWMRYATGIRENGDVFAVSDPLAGRIRELTAGKTNADELVSAYLTLDQVFGDLAGNERFRVAVNAALAGIIKAGSAAAIAGFSTHKGA